MGRARVAVRVRVTLRVRVRLYVDLGSDSFHVIMSVYKRYDLAQGQIPLFVIQRLKIAHSYWNL